MKSYTKHKTQTTHNVTVNIYKLPPFTPLEGIFYLAAIPEQVFCKCTAEKRNLLQSFPKLIPTFLTLSSLALKGLQPRGLHGLSLAHTEQVPYISLAAVRTLKDHFAGPLGDLLPFFGRWSCTLCSCDLRLPLLSNLHLVREPHHLLLNLPKVFL